jgi:hypothetical protein
MVIPRSARDFPFEALRLGGLAFSVCAGTEWRGKAAKPRSRKGDGREIRLLPRLGLDLAGEGTRGCRTCDLKWVMHGRLAGGCSSRLREVTLKRGFACIPS